MRLVSCGGFCASSCGSVVRVHRAEPGEAAEEAAGWTLPSPVLSLCALPADGELVALTSDSHIWLLKPAAPLGWPLALLPRVRVAAVAGEHLVLAPEGAPPTLVSLVESPTLGSLRLLQPAGLGAWPRPSCVLPLTYHNAVHSADCAALGWPRLSPSLAAALLSREPGSSACPRWLLVGSESGHVHAHTFTTGSAPRLSPLQPIFSLHERCTALLGVSEERLLLVGGEGRMVLLSAGEDGTLVFADLAGPAHAGRVHSALLMPLAGGGAAVVLATQSGVAVSDDLRCDMKQQPRWARFARHSTIVCLALGAAGSLLLSNEAGDVRSLSFDQVVARLRGPPASAHPQAALRSALLSLRSVEAAEARLRERHSQLDAALAELAQAMPAAAALARSSVLSASLLARESVEGRSFVLHLRNQGSRELSPSRWRVLLRFQSSFPASAGARSGFASACHPSPLRAGGGELTLSLPWPAWVEPSKGCLLLEAWALYSPRPEGPHRSSFHLLSTSLDLLHMARRDGEAEAGLTEHQPRDAQRSLNLRLSLPPLSLGGVADVAGWACGLPPSLSSPALILPHVTATLRTALGPDGAPHFSLSSASPCLCAAPLGREALLRRALQLRAAGEWRLPLPLTSGELRRTLQPKLVRCSDALDRAARLCALAEKDGGTATHTEAEAALAAAIWALLLLYTSERDNTDIA